MDQNGDRLLSKAEIKGLLQNDFTKVDTNKNGFVKEEELKKAPQPHKKRS